MSHRDPHRDEDYKQWLEHGFRQGYIKPSSSGGTNLNHSSRDRKDDEALDTERPDYEIEDEVHDKLIHHKDLDASDIEIEVSHRDVTLKGFIDDKYQRRLAEDLVLSVRGVRAVRNLLTLKQFGFQAPGNSATDS